MRSVTSRKRRGALLFCAAIVMAGTGLGAAQAAETAANAATVSVPAHQRFALGNGLTLIVMRRPEVPLIAFNAVLRGGALADPPGKAGLAAVTASLLEKGAGARDAFAFADAVAGVGGSFSASAGPEAINVTGQFLARDRELMLTLLADAIKRPRLDPAEFAKLRDREIELLKSRKDSNPEQLIGSYGRAALFGSHPFGSPLGGSERTLAAITNDDVRGYFRDQFGADRMSLILTGDIDSKWARAAVARAFHDLPRARGVLPPLPAPVPVQGRRVWLVDSPGAAQTYFWLGNVGVARKFPQRAALDIVNTLYGGRFTSVLNTELRVKSGLSYSAGSRFTRGSVPGEFAITSFAQTENAAKAIDLAIDTLARLKRDGVDAGMLDSARAYVLGQYPLQLETAAHWAVALGDLQLYGLDRSYIEAYGPQLSSVTLLDARAVTATAFPAAENLVLVLIGDAAKIRAAVAKYGPVTEFPITHPHFTPDR